MIEGELILVTFQVLSAASVKIIFWDVAWCSVVDIYRRFRGATSQKTVIFIF
jgi:hypothetical protein